MGRCQEALWCDGRFHKGNAQRQKQRQSSTVDPDGRMPVGGGEEEAEASMESIVVLSARAQKKWDELDTDQNGLLDGDEAPVPQCAPMCYR